MPNSVTRRSMSIVSPEFRKTTKKPLHQFRYGTGSIYLWLFGSLSITSAGEMLWHWKELAGPGFMGSLVFFLICICLTLVLYSQEYTVTLKGIITRNLFREKLVSWNDIHRLDWFSEEKSDGGSGWLLAYRQHWKWPILFIAGYELSNFSHLMTLIINKTKLSKKSEGAVSVTWRKSNFEIIQ